MLPHVFLVWSFGGIMMFMVWIIVLAAVIGFILDRWLKRSFQRMRDRWKGWL